MGVDLTVHLADCGFGLFSPPMMLSIFDVLIGHVYIFFGEMSTHLLSPLKKIGLLVFFIIKLSAFTMYSSFESLIYMVS